MSKVITLWKKYGMFALLIILVAGFSLASPSTFFTRVTFYNILKQASVIGVLSCGVTILLITGATDISIGARVACTTILCGTLLQKGVSIPIVIVVGIVFSAATGALNAIMAELLHTHVFVISMATMNVWTGISYLAVGPATLYDFPTAFKGISQYMLFGQVPSIILWFILCALVAAFILSKTYFGRYIYAIGGNREAAYLAGINVVKTNILAQTLAGVFIGIGSIILMSRTMTASANTGGTFAFDCITACVLGGVMLGGGRGKMYQAVLGVLVINVLFNGLTIIGVSDYWQMVTKGVILLAAISLEVFQRFSKVSFSEKASVASKENEKATKAV
ncbi:ABC transporter permease [Lacrimispora sp.]|uniref:ABC transporter permease n=1 Tax=Lacrimispora sp. TaxID=2719234 RepID=UPI0028998D6E|nr:ABC transporter permease [Lacrimispora sp.]